ncbi:Beta-hexosaminidase [Gossypium arboreum]|uniref:Beta-hexosaminidase n=1 Tax=Gossypium arboreum TaxID=29729 RepID=A0A0B0NMV8_GOSAR|nr:Beta-hexosaminidase [Gossypium arboreum]
MKRQKKKPNIYPDHFKRLDTIEAPELPFQYPIPSDDSSFQGSSPLRTLMKNMEAIFCPSMTMETSIICNDSPVLKINKVGNKVPGNSPDSN